MIAKVFNLVGGPEDGKTVAIDPCYSFDRVTLTHSGCDCQFCQDAFACSILVDHTYELRAEDSTNMVYSGSKDGVVPSSGSASVSPHEVEA